MNEAIKMIYDGRRQFKRNGTFLLTAFNEASCRKTEIKSKVDSNSNNYINNKKNAATCESVLSKQRKRHSHNLSQIDCPRKQTPLSTPPPQVFLQDLLLKSISNRHLSELIIPPKQVQSKREFTQPVTNQQNQNKVNLQLLRTYSSKFKDFNNNKNQPGQNSVAIHDSNGNPNKQQSSPVQQKLQGQQQLEPIQKHIKNHNENCNVFVENALQDISVQQQLHPLNARPGGYLSTVKKKMPNNNHNIQQSKQKCKKKLGNELTEEEQDIYGDRFLDGYKKMSLLGKGGFALVWKAMCMSTNKEVAVKQMSKLNLKNYMKELKFFKSLKDAINDDQTSINAENNNNNIIRLLAHQITYKDCWLVQELAGQSLAKCLYEIKGIFHLGQRIYEIQHTAFQSNIRSDFTLLKQFIKKTVEGLLAITSSKTAHSDLKTENILLKLNSDESQIEELKIIDFGSAFTVNDKGQISTATPEYMPPEVLQILSNNGKYNVKESQLETLNAIAPIHSTDVWSLGVILIEIMYGVPSWISYKCKHTLRSGRVVIGAGLFSAKGRGYLKIVQIQKEFVDHLHSNLLSILQQEEQLQGITEESGCIQANLSNQHQNSAFIDLLTKCLQWHPSQRIHPWQILEHPFLQASF